MPSIAPDSPLPPLLTLREVAAALRVHPRTIRRWADDGRLTAIRLTTETMRFRADEIAALIEGAETTGAATDGGSSTHTPSLARPRRLGEEVSLDGH